MQVLTVENKIKTAGNSNTNALFNSTFGSFSKAPSYKVVRHNSETMTGLDAADNFDLSQTYLENAGVDADTPTLPILENNVQHRDDQPMPQHMPMYEDNDNEQAYSYHPIHSKAIHSDRLRNTNLKYSKNNMILIKDKNFSKVCFVS